MVRRLLFGFGTLNDGAEDSSTLYLTDDDGNVLYDDDGEPLTAE